jgi:hypothetical protein
MYLSSGGTVYTRLVGKALSLMDGVDLSVGIHHERRRHEHDHDDKHDGQIQQQVQVHRTTSLVLKAQGEAHPEDPALPRLTPNPLDRDGDLSPIRSVAGLLAEYPSALSI